MTRAPPSWCDLAGMLRGRKHGYARLDDEAAPATPKRGAVDARLLEDEQYRLPGRPFPRREIVMGFVMLVFGLALILLGALDYIEHWQNHVPGAPWR